MFADAELVTEFNDFLCQDGYPCVGAKVAHNKKQIELHQFTDISSSREDAILLDDLYAFIQRYNRQRRIFFSFVCVFTGCNVCSDTGFEQALWARLQALHQRDSEKYDWDNRVSSNPQSENFSFSLGGEAFFIIGLNPHSNRRSRQFRYPSIVFNLHSQFQALKNQNKFQSMRNQIRKNDAKFCGGRNSNLADHGEQSEACQYSGRAVGDKWQCPFKLRRRHD